MRRVQRGPSTGLACQLLLLAVLDATTGLGTLGWTAGILLGAFVAGGLGRGLLRAGHSTLGAANAVTLGRAVLVGGVAALAVASWSDDGSRAALVALASVALVLDAVDGRVARRTGTVSSLGARFDMEVDALLILVLSAYDVRAVGWWVLTIGAARYLLLAATACLPWLRAPLPPRWWAKAVAAVQGVVLTVVAAGVLPRGLAVPVLAIAMALLAESFGRQVLSLWRLRVSAETHLSARQAPVLLGRPARGELP